MIVGWLATALAGDPQCEIVDIRDVVAVPAPAIIVLGERHGTQPDLWRATTVVHRLQRAAKVTVALEAIEAERQDVLDAFAAGTVLAADLPEKLGWYDAWGFPYRPYARLVTASEDGAKVVAAGLPLGGTPAEAEVAVPLGYARLLEGAMSGHAVPPEAERDFVRAMAWRDQSIAHTALAAWDGEGYLVIVTGRGHVEGGKGVNWQADRLSELPVHSFVLAWAKNPPCFAGDKVWRKDPFFG